MESTFTAGIARRDITPQENVWMGGFAFRDRPSESVLAPLHAKALALSEAGGDAALVVVAVDQGGLCGELAGTVETECKPGKVYLRSHPDSFIGAMNAKYELQS